MAGGVRLSLRGLRRPGRAWVVLALLGAGGSLAVAALPGEMQRALSWQAGAGLQPWRWVTAAWVHLNAAHLGANLAGAACVALLGWAARLPAGAALAWALAWPATQAVLVAVPGLTAYAGLSGVLHAGVGVAGAWLVITARGRPRFVGLALLAGLGLKLMLEQPWGPALRPLPGWGFASVPAAHAAGALLGATGGAIAAALSRRRSGARVRGPTISQ